MDELSVLVAQSKFLERKSISEVSTGFGSREEESEGTGKKKEIKRVSKTKLT